MNNTKKGKVYTAYFMIIFSIILLLFLLYAVVYITFTSDYSNRNRTVICKSQYGETATYSFYQSIPVCSYVENDTIIIKYFNESKLK